MKFAELDAAVVAAHAESRFDLRRVAAPEHQSSDKTVLEPAADGSGRWVVYYSERGLTNDPVYFEAEDDACDYVHARLTRPAPAPGRPVTAEEEARSVVSRHAAQARARQMLIDAGYDPDTMKPAR